MGLVTVVSCSAWWEGRVHMLVILIDASVGKLWWIPLAMDSMQQDVPLRQWQWALAMKHLPFLLVVQHSQVVFLAAHKWFSHETGKWQEHFNSSEDKPSSCIFHAKKIIGGSELFWHSQVILCHMRESCLMMFYKYELGAWSLPVLGQAKAVTIFKLNII